MDEEDLIAWQDVLDEVAAGRPANLACPFCGHRPLDVEQPDAARGVHGTKIACSRCGKFIQGSFGT